MNYNLILSIFLLSFIFKFGLAQDTVQKEIVVDNKSYEVKYTSSSRFSIRSAQYEFNKAPYTFNNSSRRSKPEHAGENPFEIVKEVLGESKIDELSKNKKNLVVFHFLLDNKGEVINVELRATKGINVEMKTLVKVLEEAKKRVKFKPFVEVKDNEMISIYQVYNFWKHTEKVR